MPSFGIHTSIVDIMIGHQKEERVYPKERSEIRDKIFVSYIPDLF